MSSSKDHDQGSILVTSAASSQPQIVGNLGVPQDGLQLQRVPVQGYPPAYPAQPGFHAPGTNRNNDFHGSYPQELNPLPYVPDKMSQGGPSQVNSPHPPGFKASELDDTNTTTEQFDGEAGIFRTLDFTEKTIRRGFILKVYGILTCQLLITVGFIALFLFHEPIKRWVQRNSYLMLAALVLYFVMAFSMICFSDIRRKAPMNFIFLGLFTVATGYLLGVITSTFDVASVMLAVGITTAVVLSLTLFALQTKYDFTGMGGYLLCALVILLLMGIMWPIMPNRILDIVYASIGALIFSLYLIYDTQLMLGGEHKYTISPEEYIFAALNLYLDVINLFIRILYIVGRR